MKSKILTAALAVAAAGAFPSGASATGVDTAVKAAGGHAAKADAALERAARLFESGRDAAAGRAFAASRREVGRAEVSARRAQRAADTPAERGRAARAVEVVAVQQDRNVDSLLALLGEADGAVETAIAGAVVTDTRGRDRAITVLVRLSESGVAARSDAGIARALQALSQDRDDEIEVAAAALASEDVSDEAKSLLGEAVERNIDGQARAGAKLAELLASDSMPEAAKEGLRRAYDAVAGEQERSAQALGGACEQMPAPVCAIVRGVVADAGQNAQELRDAQPSGAPAGSPGGQPSETPGGQPSETPGGQPSETPGGQPSETPGGQPSETPGGQPSGAPAGGRPGGSTR